jgi:hypothetical protein
MLVNTAGHGVPDASHYTRCVAELKATEPSASSLTMRELTRRCQDERYRQRFRSALIQAIHNQWLIGEAADKGIRVAKLTDRILADGRGRHRRVTQAEVARYYAGHLYRFVTYERRDVHIIRTTTRAAALAARRKIESGTSFASMAKSLSAITQPVRSEGGLIVGLTRLYYSEKPLSDAIFSARRGRVYGPVFAPERKVVLSQPGTGYFVFEVIRITPRHQRPLAQVRSEIASVLMERKEKRALASAVKTFRRKWTARTYCSPGYIVTGCREAKPSNSHPPDPYAL